MTAQKQATFKIWRGDAKGGEFRDYTTGVSEGMVVLDAVNHIQATQANDLAYRWNCKAGKCGSCSAEVNGMPKLMCMTRLSDLPLEKPVTVRANEGVSDNQRPDHGRLLEFSREEKNQEVQAAPAGCAGRHMADAAGRHRSCAGISEMYRMLSLPGRLPRAARSPNARQIYRAALFNSRRCAGDASARYRGSHRGIAKRAGDRLLQHHKVLHEGLSRKHSNHRQRNHSAEGTRRGSTFTIRLVGSGEDLRRSIESLKS